MATKKPKATSEKLDVWLAPVSDDAPCGLDLEYDPEFVVLMAKTAPRSETQYGDFIGTPEALNWADIERECERLMARSRDIRVAIVWLRARIRQAGTRALADGLIRFVTLLEHFPRDIHPQLVVDGDPDPAVRANALASLVDPEGILSDIRDLTISRGTARRLQVRDVERALAIPRPADALSADSVRQQLVELTEQGTQEFLAIGASATVVDRIRIWAEASLGHEAPDLSALTKLLAPFASVHRSTPVETPTDDCATSDVPDEHTDAPEVPATVPGQPSNSPAVAPNTEMAMIGRIGSRASALESIRQTRLWFETHEPSSPVADLLRQAERLVGKRFSEVAQSIPIDLLQKWASEHVDETLN